MKSSLVSFMFSICIFTSFAQKTLKPKDLRQDFDYAVEQLKLQHQGFYNFTDSAIQDLKIDKLSSGLDKPKTRLEFYIIIRKLSALMNEGHGSVSLPKLTMVKLGVTKSFFPLAIKHVNQQYIVTQNFGDHILGLTKGVKLISVNGKNISDLINDLKTLIATDGFIESAKYEWIGGLNFSLLMRLVYGEKSSFTIEFQQFGKDQIKTAKIPAIRYTEFKSKNAKFNGYSFSYKKFSFNQINDSIAYLSVPSFSKGDIDYERFYQESFKKIDSLKIKHLILDIQDNGGGEEGNENLLFSYLNEEKIMKYKKATMLPKPYRKRKNYKSIKSDQWELKEAIAERGSFTLYSDYYSNLGYQKPNKDLIYNGKLYVLISGKTYSGGAEFASMIEMTNRGLFIGEETGGAYEGNVSSFNQTVKLLNSKITIDIPIVHYQINVQPKNRGRGIIPDHDAPEKWEDYLNQRNSRLEFVLKELLRIKH